MAQRDDLLFVATKLPGFLNDQHEWYASFLRDQWRRYPWNIPWNHLLHYCLLPEAGPDAPGELAVESGAIASAKPVSGMRTGVT